MSDRISILSYAQKAGLNAYVLHKYFISSYTDPSQIPNNRFSRSDYGWMTINNDSDIQGEYKYLGYNVDGALISNDRWFNTADNIGKVFDREYSGIEWHELVEQQGGVSSDTTMWANLSRFDHPLYSYIINAPFFDSDHVTKGEVPTGKTLATLLPDGQWMTKSYLVTTPTQFEDGVVYLEYTKNGRRDYNTIQIPRCHVWTAI